MTPFSRTKKKHAPLDENALYDYAVKALGRRMRTVAELKRLMRGKVESTEQGEVKIDRVIARLKAQRYLNDTDYATSYARLRHEEELARRHLERKRIQKPANDKEAARVMRMLVRAGFSTGVIFKILKKWDVDEEALTALEFMDNDGPESSNGER